MAKVLTAAAINKFRPATKKRVIRDGGSRSLYLCIMPSGHKSWLMRFRGPTGKAAKMVIGSVDLSGNEVQGEPTVGMPLTLSAARQVAAQVHRDRARGSDVISDHKVQKLRRLAELTNKQDSSFSAAARSYIQEHAKPNVRGWMELSRCLGLDPDTEGLDAIPGGLASRWADRDVRSLDGHDIHAAVDEAQRIGTPGIKPRREGLSEARARSLHAALSACFGWMLRHRRIDSNPCITVFRPRPPAARERILSDAEIVVFWKATCVVSKPFGSVLKLLLLTGSRLNEIAALRWDEVSENGVELRLPGTRTKNHKSHVVPLSPMASDIIASMPHIDGCPFVFSTNASTPISGWSKTKDRLDSEMGIPPWRIHDLRRTCASGMQRLGVRVEVIEKVLNHISGKFAGVAGIYLRDQMTEETRAALERWSLHVLGLVTERPANVAPIRPRRA